MNTNDRGIVRRILALAGTGALLAGLGSLTASAQFQADYGGTGNEFGRAVHENSLGGYMVAGEAPSLFPLGQTDAYVIVTNSGSEFPMFERTYNINNGDDFATDIQETVIGASIGYIVTGYSRAVGHNGDADMFLMLLDQFGTPIWCRLYTATGISGNGNDESYHVEVVAGGYVICGRSNSNHLNHYDAVIMKTDMNGAVLWGKAYDNGASSNDNFYSCDVLPTGDLVACGATTASDADVLVARLTSAGAATWQNRYGTAGTNQGSRSIRACSSTGANPNQLIVAGNNGSSVATALLIDATTAAFTAGRTYSIAGNSYQEAMGVVEGSDSKFIFTGLVLTPTNGFGSFDFYLQRVFPNLANEWNQLQGGQGGTGDDRGWGVDVALPFNGSCDPYSIIATGMMTVTGSAQQLHLTRTDQFGLTGPCLTHAVNSTASVIAWPPVTMPAPRTWGFLLDNATPQFSDYVRDPWHCDGPLFAIVPVEPEQSTLHSISGDRHDGQASTGSSSMTSGVKEGADEASGMAAYPNPVRRGGSFVLDYLAASTAKVDVTVSDMTGRVIYEGSVEGGKMKLPISTDGWPTGSYMVKLTIDGASSTRRMVVIE